MSAGISSKSPFRERGLWSINFEQAFAIMPRLTDKRLKRSKLSCCESTLTKIFLEQSFFQTSLFARSADMWVITVLRGSWPYNTFLKLNENTCFFQREKMHKITLSVKLAFWPYCSRKQCCLFVFIVVLDSQADFKVLLQGRVLLTFC
jgi:hypothetical protein